MAVFTDVRDLEGLAESRRRGRAVGFLGRTAIHPIQLDVIRAAFTPTDGEVAQAREVLTRAAESAAAGHGAVALPDGRFVDAAVLSNRPRAVRRRPASPP
jgi:citrate lyase subunit beta/citryl-CoA lyase